MSCQYETTKDAAKAGDVTKLKRMIEKINNGLMTWHPETTAYAASYGHKKYLEICVKYNCPWHPQTTLAAANNGHKKCLEYIFENCKDLVSWEDSGLEENISEFSEEIQQYLMSVKDEWKWYKKRSQNIKG